MTRSVFEAILKAFYLPCRLKSVFIVWECAKIQIESVPGAFDLRTLELRRRGECCSQQTKMERDKRTKCKRNFEHVDQPRNEK